jgi:fructose-1,6-bisphosphatase I
VTYGFAAKIVNREVNKAGLVDILGTTGINNTTGDEVKKLDMFANEQFISALRVSGECCGMASKKMKITYRLKQKVPGMPNTW